MEICFTLCSSSKGIKNQWNCYYRQVFKDFMESNELMLSILQMQYIYDTEEEQLRILLYKHMERHFDDAEIKRLYLTFTL